MSHLSVLTLNVQGCGDSLKRYEIINFTKQLSKQIICLQDTHTILKDEPLWRLLWRGPIFFSHLSTRRGGIIIDFSERMDFNLIHCEEIIQGRLLHIIFKSDDVIYHIINIYASPESAEKIMNFRKLDFLLSGIKTEPVFLSGDFNVTLDPSLDRSGDRESQVEPQRVLQLLVLEYSLIDSFRRTNGNEIIFTWSRDNSCSRLDRIYVSSHISNRLIYSSVMRCPYSDHDAYCTAIMTTQLKQQSAY